jgi:hypothetical protein
MKAGQRQQPSTCGHPIDTLWPPIFTSVNGGSLITQTQKPHTETVHPIILNIEDGSVGSITKQLLLVLGTSESLNTLTVL